MTQDTAPQTTFISLFNMWYDSYRRLILLIGGAALGLLSFSATFIVKELMIAPEVAKDAMPKMVGLQGLPELKCSWVLLGLSAVAVFLNLFLLYNWYAAVLKVELLKAEIDPRVRKKLFGHEKLGSIRFWGEASLWMGIAAGLLFLTGLSFFVMGSYHLVGSIQR